MLYKPRALLKLSVLKVGATTESDSVDFAPLMVDSHWERNHHLMADTLSTTIPWREGGIDPRMLKNARCEYYLWDSNYEPFDAASHLRFTGICKTAKRSMSDSTAGVDLKFHDYTDMFISMKPFPPDGVPNFTDTLESAWKKICDHTGWWDLDGKKIISNVTVLRDNLVFDTLHVPRGPIGKAVATRFHAVAKPQPPTKASAWEVWQYICGMVGVISYIEADHCVITTDAALYSESQAAGFLHGLNIRKLEEDVDTGVSNKAILLKSFDPLTGAQLESIYPTPGDPRVKTPRSAARRVVKKGGKVTDNDVSGELEEFFRYDITDQATLDLAAAEAYHVRSRQELSGSFETAEMRVPSANGQTIDVLTLGAGNPIVVGIDSAIREVRNIEGGWFEQLAYLTDRLHYDEGVARLILANLEAITVKNPIYHVKSMDVQLGPEKFEIEIKYHNIIRTDH